MVRLNYQIKSFALMESDWVLMLVFWFLFEFENDGMKLSKRHSLISLPFILNCLSKTLVIRIIKSQLINIVSFSSFQLYRSQVFFFIVLVFPYRTIKVLYVGILLHFYAMTCCVTSSLYAGVHAFLWIVISHSLSRLCPCAYVAHNLFLCGSEMHSGSSFASFLCCL